MTVRAFPLQWPEHPDKLHGSREAFVELGVARDDARAHYGEVGS